MESSNEEVDIVLKKTELGKYLASPDVTSAVPYNIFADEPEREDKNCFDPEPSNNGGTSPENSSPLHFTLPGSEKSGSSSDYSESEDDYSIIVDSEAIHNRFSREYRLVHNSRYLGEKSAELIHLLNQIEKEAEELSQIKHNMPGRTEIVENLSKLKHEFNSQLMDFQHLTAVESLLLEQTTVTAEIKDKRPTWMFDDDEPLDVPVKECVEQSLTENLSGIFETNITISESCVATEDTIEQDEIYEASEEILNAFTSENSVPIQDTVEKEFASTQRIVLDELKNTLRPRRAEMLNREKEAFVRTYGFMPDYAEEPQDLDKIQDSFDLQKNNPEAQLPSQSSPNSTQGKQLDSNTYGDSVVEEDILSNQFINSTSTFFGTGRPNFLELLEKTLEGRRSDIPGGLIPKYKEMDTDSDSD